MKTTRQLDLPDTNALRRVLGQTVLKMAKRVGREAIEDMRKPKTGKRYGRLKNRSANKGESPREQSKRLTRSMRAERTGDASARTSFDTPYSNRQQFDYDHPILPDSKVPEWEKELAAEVEGAIKKVL